MPAHPHFAVARHNFTLDCRRESWRVVLLAAPHSHDGLHWARHQLTATYLLSR